MNTKAVRIYGVKDLRLEEFELPTMKDDEIEARIVTDSLCMSTYKVSNQGEKHKKLPSGYHGTRILRSDHKSRRKMETSLQTGRLFCCTAKLRTCRYFFSWLLFPICRRRSYQRGDHE